MKTTTTRNAVLEKARQLVNLLQESDEMKRFRQAQDKINRHADAQALLFIVKAKRNAFSQTSLRYGYDHPKSLQAEKEYKEVLERIAQIPLIDEYKEAQEELNDIVQGVLNTIVATVSHDLPLEKCEEPGDGAAGGCGSCSSGGCGRR
jgi:cell fate (sporulation/competence/biofilm development) regulator YmcA (YheA/YmcA/DUF963 family)